jgi:hypothetical protein
MHCMEGALTAVVVGSPVTRVQACGLHLNVWAHSGPEAGIPCWWVPGCMACHKGGGSIAAAHGPCSQPSPTCAPPGSPATTSRHHVSSTYGPGTSFRKRSQIPRPSDGLPGVWPPATCRPCTGAL